MAASLLALSSKKTISKFSLLQGHHVDTINLSLLRLFEGFELSSYGRASVDHPYFPYGTPQMVL